MKDSARAAMDKAFMLADSIYSIVTGAIILGTIVGFLAFAIYLAWR